MKLHSLGVAERQNEGSAGAASRAERVISNLKGRFNRSDEVPLPLPARLLERFFVDLERAHDCAGRGPWRQDLCTAHSGSVPILWAYEGRVAYWPSAVRSILATAGEGRLSLMPARPVAASSGETRRSSMMATSAP